MQRLLLQSKERNFSLSGFFLVNGAWCLSDKEKNLFGMDSTSLRDITERNPGLKLRNIVFFPAGFVPISTKYIFASVNTFPSFEFGERWRAIGQHD